jgi:hypothetical protein
MAINLKTESLLDHPIGVGIRLAGFANAKHKLALFLKNGS